MTKAPNPTAGDVIINNGGGGGVGACCAKFFKIICVVILLLVIGGGVMIAYSLDLFEKIGEKMEEAFSDNENAKYKQCKNDDRGNAFLFFDQEKTFDEAWVTCERYPGFNDYEGGNNNHNNGGGNGGNYVEECSQFCDQNGNCIEHCSMVHQGGGGNNYGGNNYNNYGNNYNNNGNNYNNYGNNYNNHGNNYNNYDNNYNHYEYYNEIESELSCRKGDDNCECETYCDNRGKNCNTMCYDTSAFADYYNDNSSDYSGDYDYDYGSGDDTCTKYCDDDGNNCITYCDGVAAGNASDVNNTDGSGSGDSEHYAMKDGFYENDGAYNAYNTSCNVKYDKIFDDENQECNVFCYRKRKGGIKMKLFNFFAENGSECYDFNNSTSTGGFGNNTHSSDYGGSDYSGSGGSSDYSGSGSGADYGGSDYSGSGQGGSGDGSDNSDSTSTPSSRTIDGEHFFSLDESLDIDQFLGWINQYLSSDIWVGRGLEDFMNKMEENDQGGNSNQGNHNQGNNQGNPNQGNPNQGNPNQGNPNQGNPNQGNNQGGNPNQGGNQGGHQNVRRRRDVTNNAGRMSGECVILPQNTDRPDYERCSASHAFICQLKDQKCNDL